jgi:hypothetical protein
MSEKNKQPQKTPKPKQQEQPKPSRIGESKQQQDILKKGAEIPPPTKKSSK